MDNKLYKLMNWPEIESIVYSDCDHPESILGMHSVTGGFVIQAFFPDAVKVYVNNLSADKKYEMELVDEEGFYAVFVPGKKFSYEYIVVDKENKERTEKEVYNYIPVLWTNLLDKFREGILYDSYKYFGAHFCERKGLLGTEFMVYAPNAARVSVVGDFNNWDGRVNPLSRISEDGIFAIFIPLLPVGSLYKFEIKLRNGLTFLKRDPFAFSLEKGAGDASRVIMDIEWEHIKYKRKELSNSFSLLNVNLNEFINKEGVDLPVDTIASRLVKKVKDTDFTGILFDDFSVCTKKQVTNYGKPSLFSLCPENFRIEDMVKLINILHEADIFVSATFDFSGMLSDDFGLRYFDGSNLFELDDKEIDGLLSFDFSKTYIRNYLISVCDYFTKLLSLDGICVDGIDRILYLDYKRSEGEFRYNMYGGNENLDGIEFIKHLNSILHKRYSNFTTIASGSLVSNNLTSSFEEGGMGFDYKLHSLFDKDLLSFVSLSKEEQKKHFIDLTYSPLYIYCEKFILKLSYKDYGSSFEEFVNRFSEDNNISLAAAKLVIAYLYVHPGRKCIPFYDVKSPEILNMIKTLNALYLSAKGNLSDDDNESFAWVNAIDSENLVISFMRDDGKESFLCVCNFSDDDLDYKLYVDNAEYKEIFSTDQIKFKGSHRLSSKSKTVKAVGREKQRFMVSLKLAAKSLYIYEKCPCQKK